MDIDHSYAYGDIIKTDHVLCMHFSLIVDE